MRPSCEQLLEREPRDLAPDAVEARQQHRAGRVVDDEVDPGEGLERADVAALPADDPALQLVGLELHRPTPSSRRRARRPPAACRWRGCCARGGRRRGGSPPPPGGSAGRCRGAARPRARARRICLAWPALSPETRSSSRTCWRLRVLQARDAVLEVARLVGQHALALVERLPPWRAGAPRAARPPRGGRAAPPRGRRGAGASAPPGARLGLGSPSDAGRRAGRSRDRGRRRRRGRAAAGRAATTHRETACRYQGRKQDLHVAVSSPGRGRAPFSACSAPREHRGCVAGARFRGARHFVSSLRS